MDTTIERAAKILTNEEKTMSMPPNIFKKLINQSKLDILVAPFLHQALRFYSEAVMEEMSDDDNDRNIINPRAWRETATSMLKIIKELEQNK